MSIYIEDVSDIAKYMREYWSMSDGYSMRKDLKPDDYIWSEDETVRRNRELTKDYNDTIHRNIKMLQDMKMEFRKELDDEILRYIIEYASYEDVKFNNAMATKIWDYCTTEHEDEPWAYLSETIDLVCSVIMECFKNEADS